MKRRAARTLLISKLPGLSIAMDALSVQDVRRDRYYDRGIDLALLFGIEPPSGRRRHLGIKGSDPFSVIAGNTVAFVEVEPTRLKRVPKLLAMLGERLGLLGLVDLEENFALLLDPERLRDAVTDHYQETA